MSPKKLRLVNSQESIDFYQNILQIVNTKRLTYIEAVVEYCDSRDIEIEVASLLINEQLKYEIEQEAKKLHMLKKETSNSAILFDVNQ